MPESQIIQVSNNSPPLLFPPTSISHSQQENRSGDMATAAAQTMLRCLIDGSISMHDMEIERRPYHRNCGCALHESKGTHSAACFQNRNISFPKKQLRNDCSLSLESSKSHSQSSFHSVLQLKNRECTDEALSLKWLAFQILSRRLVTQNLYLFRCPKSKSPPSPR